LVCGNEDKPKLVVANVMSKCPRHCTREIDEHLDENAIEISQSSGDLTINNVRDLDSLKVSKMKK
jgi:hypothetical protein